MASLQLIKNLKTYTVPQLTAITDALYEGDPDGTNADSTYFINHVHPYLKNIGVALQPENTKYISNLFTIGSDEVGDPFFSTINLCYTELGTESTQSNNKMFVYLCNRGTSYPEDLTFNLNNCYIIFQGASKYGTIIDHASSAPITISGGTHIFRNIKFNNSIVITGGTTVFENCQQTEGTTNIQQGSTVIISKSDYWGKISINNNLSGVNLWCEDILNMGYVTNLQSNNATQSVGTQSGNTVQSSAPLSGVPTKYSIVVPSTLTNSVIVIRRVAAQGVCSDPNNLINEISGFEANVTARPII